jgi:acyl-CoA reductase-like NAD-dependent aldehyde dehydrogenase
VPIYQFKSDTKAINMANDTEFGLAAYFYRIWGVAEALEYGMVGINEGIISTEIAPFGGMKEDGIGPICWSTGARNTASRNSWRSNTFAWAGRPGSDRTA